MKKLSVLGILAGMCFLLAVSAYAGGAARLRVNVPFAFIVDKEQLPAGEYVFEMRPISSYAATASSVWIQSNDGSIAAWIITSPGDGPNRIAVDQITFNRYGNKFFLAKVECLEFSANLKATKAEIEMRAQGLNAPVTTLVAAK